MPEPPLAAAPVRIADAPLQTVVPAEMVPEVKVEATVTVATVDVLAPQVFDATLR